LKNQKIIYVIRTVHTFIAAFFIFCIGLLYYFAFTGKSSPWAIWIIAILLIEGWVLMVNRGRCPLSFFHRKFGDDKKFYDLFFPEKVAVYTTHILGIISIVGIILFLVKHGI
jgi:hypothetical protein